MVLNREWVPVQPEVAFACEMLGLDPLELSNEGKMVVVVSGQDAEAALACLREDTHGRHAAIVREVSARHSDRGRVIAVSENQKLLLERHSGPLLPRLC